VGYKDVRLVISMVDKAIIQRYLALVAGFFLENDMLASG
jgi:hypothetical protein